MIQPFKLRLVFIAALVAWSACCGSGCGDRPPATSPTAPPHIVLITSDALRADHLSLNGYPRATTPRIDAFAARAIRFTEAITVIPKTSPSFATFFTGWHPEEHGVRSNLETVPPDAPLLAEILKGNGYRTAAFLSNPVLQAKYGLGRGFDRYELFPDSHGMQEVLRAFLSWADPPWNQPTFVWIHLIDPHGPYAPPPETESLFTGDALDRDDRRAPIHYRPIEGFDPNKILGAIPAYQLRGSEDRVSSYVRAYDAEIRSMDEIVGQVLAFLDARGLSDKSAIIFTSDHGESLGENDYYFEHGWYAYDSSLRVPLILKAPGRAPARRIDEQVTNLDFFPTIVRLARIENRWAGLGKDLLGPLEEGRAAIVENSGRYPERYLGLRARSLKYIRQSPQGKEELFDLTADPRESVNLSGKDPTALRAARERLAGLVEQLRELQHEPSRGESAEQQAYLEDLRRLGYVN